MARQVVLDTETTGLRIEDGHRLIEIGCIEMINRKLTNRHFHYYVNPQREVEAGAIAVHGITNEFLQDKPLFSTITKEFIEFISGAELIIHNAAFDVGFLNHELMLARQGWKTISDYSRVTDTLLLARQLHVGQRNSLDALCKRYGIDNTKRELHGALLDASLLAQVYLAMTGGQGSFFDEAIENPEVTSARVDTENTALTKKHRLIVIPATPEETAEHLQYLEKMQKHSKCMWSEIAKNGE